jgi:hypothetical protein
LALPDGKTNHIESLSAGIGGSTRMDECSWWLLLPNLGEAGLRSQNEFLLVSRKIENRSMITEI